MTIYNGLPPSCEAALTSINLKYIETGKPPVDNIKNFTDFYADFNIESNGKYKIDQFDLKCNGLLPPLHFEDFEFEPLEKEDDVVPNLSILITYDLKDPSKGVIKVGKHNGPLDKTKTGMPEIK